MKIRKGWVTRLEKEKLSKRMEYFIVSSIMERSGKIRAEKLPLDLPN